MSSDRTPAGSASVETPPPLPVALFQKTLKHTRYGRISVKCYYDAPEQRLTVEILHAADIMALDANGRVVAVRWLEFGLTPARPSVHPCVRPSLRPSIPASVRPCVRLSPAGLSDPFVIVELCPHHLFPMAKSQRTQVKLKTLHPVFDELFYL